MAKTWTRQGIIDTANSSQETFTDSLTRIRQSFRTTSFIHDIDRQTQAIIWCQQAGALGHSSVTEVIKELGQTLSHVPPLRLKYILEMRDPSQIRAALSRSHHTPRPATAEEAQYPSDGWLGTYLAYARESNAPIGFHFWLGSALMGAALRRNLYLPLGYDLFPNHYLFLVGGSAIGKSSAFNHARPILHKLNHLVVELLSGYRVGPDSPIPNLTITMLEDDLTPEHMIKRLMPEDIPAYRSIGDDENLPLTLRGMDSCGVLWNDELVTLAGKHKYGAAGIFQIVTGLYTCPSEYRRGTRGFGEEALINPTLNFATASTLEWINRSISEDMFEGGFMSRCMFSYRDELGFEPYGLEPSYDPIAQHALAKMLVPWMVMQPRPATFTRGAKKLWIDTVHRAIKQIETSDDQRMQPYFQRKKNHIGKVALTLLASRYTGDPESFEVEELQAQPAFILSEELLQQAIDLVEYEEQFLEECFVQIGQHRDAGGMERLRSYVASRNRATRCPIPIRQAKRRGAQIFGTDVAKAIVHMESMGMISMRNVRKNNSGPPTPEVWDPEVLGKAPRRHWWDAEQRLERET